jgi:glycosyltransferase involved in cell wall biosynthesis
MNTKTLTAAPALPTEEAKLPDVQITIALCTHNRADMFAECLAALLPQLGSAFELIVVDSASAPEQAALVAEAVAAYPGIAFLRLDEPGLSRARNAILGQAKGAWFATLDDDAVPAPDWAKAALEITTNAPEPFVIVGGAVHPIIPKGAERPLGPRWQQLLSTIELEGEYDQTPAPRVVAANLFFRTQALRYVGGFPEALGRVGGSLISGEDKFPVQQLLRRGGRIWYSDRIKVGHHIHRERLTRRWAARRAYWDGRSDLRIERLLGVKHSMSATAAVAVKFLALAPLYFVPDASQEYFLRFWYNIGWLQETLFSPHPQPA